MPELPETETIARDLDAAIGGSLRRILSVTVAKADVLRGVTPAELEQRTAGSTILRCWRRAKMIVIDLSTADRIVVQPRFTGALLSAGGRVLAVTAVAPTLAEARERSREAAAATELAGRQYRRDIAWRELDRQRSVPATPSTRPASG